MNSNFFARCNFCLKGMSSYYLPPVFTASQGDEQLLYATSIDKLQRVQNTLARVVNGHKRTEHITPVLADMHWLPVKFSVTFEIASLTLTIRKSGQPAYRRTLISDYRHTRDLLSSSRDLIATKRSKKAKGARAFSCIAMSIWNTLLRTIKLCESVLTFRKHLKAHLYTEHFVI